VNRQGPAMPITERTSHRLVLKSGSTTLPRANFRKIPKTFF
jgi:hypothetical protein